jgi:hypothetical protein
VVDPQARSRQRPLDGGGFQASAELPGDTAFALWGAIRDLPSPRREHREARLAEH